MSKIKHTAIVSGRFVAQVEYEFEENEDKLREIDDECNSRYEAVKQLKFIDLDDFDYDVMDIFDSEDVE